MKTTIRVIILFVFASILIFGKLAAQSDDGESGKNRTVYWFYINIRVHEDPRTGYISQRVRSLGSRIYHDKLVEYDRILWKHLSTGKRFAVGPFYEYEEARQAVKFYGYKKEEMELDTTYDESRNLHWFMLKVERRQRSQSYLLKRIPGAIGEGTYERFFDNYKAGLVNRILPIGPFWSSEEAEEAKRRYRLH